MQTFWGVNKFNFFSQNQFEIIQQQNKTEKTAKLSI